MAQRRKRKTKSEIKQEERIIYVPTRIVQNTENSYLHYSDFALYVGLKKLSFNNVYDKHPDYISQFMNWSQNKTLYKHMDILKLHNLIEHDYTNYPNHGNLKIKINNENPYVGLKESTIKKVNDNIINELNQTKKTKSNELMFMAIRLYYYYKLRYNENIGYAFPSINLVRRETGIHKNNIILLNNIFEKNHLIIMEHGNWDKQCIDKKKKFHNKYIPILETNNHSKTDFDNDT